MFLCNLLLPSTLRSAEHKDASISPEEQSNETLDCVLDRERNTPVEKAVQLTLEIRYFYQVWLTPTKVQSENNLVEVLVERG